MWCVSTSYRWNSIAAIVLSGVVAAGVVIVSWAAPPVEPAPVPASGSSPDDDTPIADKQTTGYALAYSEFIEQLLANHPDLQQARIDMGIAEAERLSKQGAFDPFIDASSFAEEFNSSSAEGKDQFATQSEVKLTLPTRIGAKIIAGGKLATGDIKTPVSPTGDGGEYFWGVKLPLLRGFLINEKFALEKQAKIKETMAAVYYRKSALSLLEKANKTYWDWVAAYQSVRVVEALKELADIRLEQIQRRVVFGDLAAIVATEAKREVAKRQGQLAETLRAFQKQSFALGLYLWQQPEGKGEMVAINQQMGFAGQQLLSPLQSQLFIPDIQLFANRLVNAPDELGTDMLRAIANRPEVQVIGLSQMIAQVDKSLATNNLLPQLDLSATQGLETGNNGIGPVFRAGVQMNIPLRYRTPLGERRQARLLLDQLSIERQQLEQQLRTEVADAASEWEALYQQYQAALLEYETAEALAEGERIRFRLGDTTLFLVNNRERAAADAQLKLISQRNKLLAMIKRYQLVLGEFIN